MRPHRVSPNARPDPWWLVALGLIGSLVVGALLLVWIPIRKGIDVLRR